MPRGHFRARQRGRDGRHVEVVGGGQRFGRVDDAPATQRDQREAVSDIQHERLGGGRALRHRARRHLDDGARARQRSGRRRQATRSRQKDKGQHAFLLQEVHGLGGDAPAEADQPFLVAPAKESVETGDVVARADVAHAARRRSSIAGSDRAIWLTNAGSMVCGIELSR